MSELDSKALWEQLKEEAEERFNFQVLKCTPIQRGWLNQKWKMETNKGSFLIKQYNRERMKKYDLQTVKSALHIQNYSFLNGIPCPELLTHDGEVLHMSKYGELFTVMRYMEGDLIKAGTATTQQMESLGAWIGKLHNVFNDGHLPPKTETVFQLPPIEERLAYWDSVLSQCEEEHYNHLKPAFQLQKEATNTLDGSDFKSLTPGWCHRDLWADNLLFSTNEVKAILDFDRMNFDFIELDLGRIIISTCLLNGKLNQEAVQAFVKGYRDTNKLSIERIIVSLKLVWYMESTWWVSIIPHEGEPPKRFKEEMNWLAKNLGNLEDILSWKKEAKTFMF